MVIAKTPSEGRGGGSAPAIFGAILALMLVSIGAPALLLGLGRTPPSETPTPTPAPTAAAGQATTPPASTDRVRILSATGSSTPADDGRYRLTFTWTLQGANENDSVAILVYAGNQLLGGEQEGRLDPSVFSFSTGRFTITIVVPCSPSGWSAELIRVRDQPVEGDGEATVPGVTCP